MAATHENVTEFSSVYWAVVNSRILALLLGGFDMRTYIYQTTSSPVRGFNTRITVHRIKRNRPHFVGNSDHNTASWKGAESQAIQIIHECDGIPYGVERDGRTNEYTLRGEIGPAYKYTDGGHYRDAVRIFGL